MNEHELKEQQILRDIHDDDEFWDWNQSVGATFLEAYQTLTSRGFSPLEATNLLGNVRAAVSEVYGE